MQNFDILRESEVDKTFRVAQIENDFDLNIEKSVEHFKGSFDFPENWQIGLIVGGSGTGKSTIANEIFSNNVIQGFEYTHKSVVDDMPKNMSLKEISKLFYSVGFGSVPSWLKPYHVLSNGEKMRVDIARALAEKDLIVFDEFTSVVDRKVARTTSIAINKAIKKSNKQFVAISCHFDITEWLQPDWVFNTDTMQFYFTTGTDPKNGFISENAIIKNGENLGSITI